MDRYEKQRRLLSKVMDWDDDSIDSFYEEYFSEPMATDIDTKRDEVECMIRGADWDVIASLYSEYCE